MSIVEKHGDSVEFKYQIYQGNTFILQIILTSDCAKIGSNKNHHHLAAI